MKSAAPVDGEGVTNAFDREAHLEAEVARAWRELMQCRSEIADLRTREAARISVFSWSALVEIKLAECASAHEKRGMLLEMQNAIARIVMISRRDCPWRSPDLVRQVSAAASRMWTALLGYVLIGPTPFDEAHFVADAARLERLVGALVEQDNAHLREVGS